MSPSKALPPNQARFVTEYVIDLNATQAAIRAGYSAHTARQQGTRLLSKASVKAAIAKGLAPRLQQAELSAQRTLEEIRRLAFADIRTLFDATGNMRQIKELSEAEAACIAGFEVVKRNLTAGDGFTDEIHKVKLSSKIQALELAARHFSLLNDTLTVLDGDKIIERLHAGRNHVAKKR